MTLLPAQRRLEILRAVRNGTAHGSDLAESFGVSEMTVRRDLGALARDGKLERVHGGAVDHGGEPGFSQIEVERFDVKDRLGAAAAALAEDSLRQLKADIAFLGTSAVDLELGVWDTTMVEVPIKRLMISGADCVVLIAD